ncbi:hypothetical protein BN1723_015938, partial [Verticillium longisporum]
MRDMLYKTTGVGEQRNFLNDAFASAYRLASMAEDYTNENFNADGTQLFQWLHGTVGLDMMRTSVKSNLAGIMRDALPVEGGAHGGDRASADVRVFCTHDRLREGRAREDGSKILFDPVTKDFLQAKFDCTHALAWTIQPGDPEEPDTLQICPWFLDYAMKQTAKFHGKYTP